METEFISSFHFPPGFRFYPSDEELIEHYLLNKLKSRPLPANIIADIELYNYNPWDLPKKALFGEEEWYFFSPRDRKYPHGARPNRTAGMGFWKATGTDKPILNSCGSRRIGVKKALVFYTGRPPNGFKTEWIMNEYRLPDLTRPPISKESMRLDDWVLCRVRRKGNMSKNRWEEAQGSPTKCVPIKIEDHHQLPSSLPYTNNYANYTSIIKDDDLFNDCHDLLASMLAAGQNLPPIDQPLSSTTSFPIRSNKNNEDFSQGNNILDANATHSFNQSQCQGEIFDFDTSNIVMKLQEFDAAALCGRFLQ